MKNNKRYIILITILVAFFLVMYMLYGRGNIEKQKVKTTILLNPNTVFLYRQNEWYRYDKEEISKLNWNKYNIYLDSNYKGEFYVWHDDEWYLFDEDKNAINYSEKFLGIKANYDIKVKDFYVEENSNSEYTKEILSSNDISTYSELTVNDKIDVDIDNDGTNETIYIVSNTFPTETNPNTIFSFVFMVKDNKIIQIYSNKIQGDAYSGCMPYVNSILDADDDNNYEIVLTCARFSEQEPINSLYKFENNQFKQLISSE